MRRKDLETTHETAIKWFNESRYLVLSMTDSENNPYAIPISFAVEDDVVYVHGASEGKKFECIKDNPNVCLVTVNADSVVPYAPGFTTSYQSTVVFGKAEIITDEDERKLAMWHICKKYVPSSIDGFDAEAEKFLSHATVVKIPISSITGKSKSNPA